VENKIDIIKNKAVTPLVLIRFAILGILVSLIPVVITDFFKTQKQEQIISKQTEIIRKTAIVDSIYLNKTKQFSNVITKYISEDNFLINGNKVSTADIVDILNKKIEQNQKLSDSISHLNNILAAEKDFNLKYLDSFVRFRYVLNDIKKVYGIQYDCNKLNDKIYFTHGISKADSGLLLLKYFRNRITRYADSGNSIYTDVSVFKEK